MSIYAQVLDRLAQVTGVAPRGPGDNKMARCPAHEDQRASLSVSRGDDAVVLHCHAGCATEAVLARLNLTFADLYDDDAPTTRGVGGRAPDEITDTYDYVDEQNELLFQVARLSPKGFRQRKSDGNGGWTWKLGDTRRVIYRLPQVLEAVHLGKLIAVVEGEKDVHALEAAGYAATCNPGGALKWRDTYSQPLAGANVMVIADRDEPGRRHAAHVAESLRRVAAKVEVFEPAHGKDISDHLNAGLTLEELEPVDLAHPPPPGTNHDTLARPVLVQMSDVQPEEVSWLWPGRVPRGKITMVDGDPGTGKSTVALDLAARVSSGASMPDASAGGPGPANVLVLTAEDGLADTVAPRLTAAGADLARVRVLAEVEELDGSTRPPVIPGDVALLERVIREDNVVLLIVDVIPAYLSSATDSYKDADVRRALHPLAKLAERTGAAVVLLRHLSKSGGANAVYRGGGSIGIIGAARMGLLVAQDPDDDDRRILAVTKSNLCPKAESLAFRLLSAPGGCARVVWEGTTGHQANDLLMTGAEDSGATAEGMDFLRDLLADGPVAASTVEAEAKRAGLSFITLRRQAKARLDVKSVKVGAPGDKSQGWFWKLPDDEGDQETPNMTFQKDSHLRGKWSPSENGQTTEAAAIDLVLGTFGPGVEIER